MQIAGVSHGERLKTLLLRLEQGVTRDKAAEEYSAGVLEDTMAWGEIGIRDFYPGVDGTEVSSGYRRAIEAWRAGTAQTPLEELERQLRSPRGPVAAARRHAPAQVVTRERAAGHDLVSLPVTRTPCWATAALLALQFEFCFTDISPTRISTS